LARFVAGYCVVSRSFDDQGIGPRETLGNLDIPVIVETDYVGKG
jgi:hypothetical protein